MTSLQMMLKKAEINKTLSCPVKGCTSKRSGIAKYCSGHQNRKLRYGDVHGRPIYQKDYLKELKEVREFFIKHESHPALASAVYFFQNWMTKAAANDAAVGQKTMGRLYRDGIEPRVIVEEIVAIWLYSQKYPNSLPDDLRLTYALARNTIRLVGFSKHTSSGGNSYINNPNPNELRTVGEYIRHSMARFMLNVQHALKAEQEADTALRENLSIPFNQ